MATYSGTGNNDNINAATLNLADWTNIDAGAGDDTVSAGKQNVELGPGNDRLTGTINTSLVYWSSPAGVTVDLGAGTAQDGHGGTDTFTGIRQVMGSVHNDTIKAAGEASTIWLMGGQDTVLGVSGKDTVVIQTTAAAGAPTFRRSDGNWIVEYGNQSPGMHSATLGNIKLVREWVDGTTWRMWDLGGDTARPVADRSTVFAPAPGLPDTGWWQLGQWKFVSKSTSETHTEWYYPTVNDYNPPGTFSIDSHNAALGDFNGDGKEDMVISWAVFPHTLERELRLPPTILLGGSGKLEVMPESALPATLVRHFAYRTMVGDFNNDGIDDFGSAGMGVIKRDATVPGGYVNRWEPAVIALSKADGSGFTDGSAGLAGQTLTDANASATFMHDFAVGDVNKDGIDDVFAGSMLWLSKGAGQWNDGSAALSGLLPNAKPNSSAIADLDGDGDGDLVAMYPDFAANRIVLLNNGGHTPGFTRLELPAGLYGTNTKDNFSIVADVNRDGRPDLVVAETRATPYYTGAAIQILVQTANGTFEDQTAGRIDNSARDATHGEGSLFFKDANGDGHPDLLHVNSAEGIAIFLNDGGGRFTLADGNKIPFIRKSQLEGWQDSMFDETGNGADRAYPIHINDDGILDFVVQKIRPQSASPQTAPTELALYTLVSNGDAFGRNQSESLAGSILDDKIYGLGGDDALAGGKGNDSLDGGAGFDSAIYNGARNMFTLGRTSAGHTVSDSSGSEGVDALAGIERIKFSDMSVDLTIGAAARTIAAADLKLLQELYVAFFNRVPDADGLGYWIGQFKAGLSFAQIADSFYDAAVQYTALTGYSATMSNDEFVRVIYKNVLGRSGTTAPPDADVQYWSGELTAGRATKGSLVSTMLSSAHSFKGHAAWGWVADLLDNKVAVADYFAVQQGLSYNMAEDSITKGMAIAAAVTAFGTADAIELIGVAGTAMLQEAQGG